MGSHQKQATSHQGPQNWKHPGCTQYEQAAQSLGVVSLNHLDDPQEGFDSWSPEVTHV